MGRPATLKVDIVTDAKKVGPGVDEASSKLGKLGSIGKKVGIGVAAGLGVAAAAAGKFALDSIDAASTVQQSFGALDTIYGKHAASVKRWAAGAAESVGLAKGEYASLSGLVGAQLQNMGASQAESAKKSRELIKVGADMAATYGGTVSEAVSAVSSLLKGESDPIERYAVGIKASDVSARLAADGLDKLTGKAASQAKMQATLALLTEQTAKTQGAFAKESNTLAGQQERLKAKFENLKATLGEKLLPVATKVVSWASNKMLPAAQRLGAWLATNLGPAFAKVGAFITTKVVPAARAFVAWFVDKIVPGIRRYVTPVLDGVRELFGKLSAAIERNREPLGKIGTALKTVAEFIAQKVMPIVGKLAGILLGELGRALGAVIDGIGRMVGWLDTAIDKIGDLIGWIGKIDMPNIDIPFVGGAVGNLTTGVQRLVGDSGSMDLRRGFTTGAGQLGAGTWQAVTSDAGRIAGGTLVIDARTTVEVDNRAGLADEYALIARLMPALRAHAQRQGTTLLSLLGTA